MMLNCHIKNKSKQSSCSGDILCLRIGQSVWPRECQDQSPKTRFSPNVQFSQKDNYNFHIHEKKNKNQQSRFSKNLSFG